MNSSLTRIGLIFGSRSVEREVSIMTAGKVYEVLLSLQDRFETLPIFLTAEGTWLTGEAVRDLLMVDAEIRKLAERGAMAGPDERVRLDAEKLRLNRERYAPQLENLDRGVNATGVEPLFLSPDPSVGGLMPQQERKGWLRKTLHPTIDVAFPVIHGTHGEDGTIQGLCELANLPYVGAGVAASAVGMDKIISKLVFQGAGLPVVEGIGVTRRELLEDEAAVVQALERILSYPVVVKPAVAGSSVGIGVAHDAVEALSLAKRAMRFSCRVLVERAVQQRIEVQCGVIGNHALTVSECEELISSGEVVGYRDKYPENKKPGSADLAPSIIPARIPQALSDEIRSIAAAAFKSIDSRGISRVDFLVDSAAMKPYVNEINTMPGSLSLTLWERSGVKPAELIVRLVELALEAHRDKRSTQFKSTEGKALVDRRHLVTPGK
ncbi:MAG: D-alanine--D-alanine ligase [Candidatus Methylomirabilis oxygeniifera]|uniref:D-alanine--D-alanine ligase n=1 Tax=Methylomirabilis oxygeniifera TaxID=671143 RepID=D5MI58_METO1|nr:MAG: D-alanine--D-alanine ligase [Candidatus Methylomirabilis oxyfera]CBE69351.1 putative D-alanine--D-alanine ligase A (D-alanylalanine synthetase A) (D-Ala-D-Ala ligase A) [Candidatus Methylomirabilis oxyfera]